MPHDHAERLARAGRQAELAGLDAIVVAPGPDLMYLTGYGPPPLERLTSLVIRPGSDPILLVPTLERPRAAASPAEFLVGFVTWSDGDSMHAALGRLLPERGTIGVIDQMWAWHLMELEARCPPRPSSPRREPSRLRVRKDAGELELLARAGRAADEAFARVAKENFAGRAEEQIAGRLRELLVEEGCDAASFWIVASGPNGASPHHEPGVRDVQAGDLRRPRLRRDGRRLRVRPVPDRLGGGTPAEVREVHDVVRRAQEAAFQAVRPGVRAQDSDHAARHVIEEAGFGAAFIHRTGHGIGLEAHEEPYMVRGNEEVLEPGMCFSIEPGIYLEGRFGVRIEDIVAVTEDGAVRLNEAPRELTLVAEHVDARRELSDHLVDAPQSVGDRGPIVHVPEQLAEPLFVSQQPSHVQQLPRGLPGAGFLQELAPLAPKLLAPLDLQPRLPNDGFEANGIGVRLDPGERRPQARGLGGFEPRRREHLEDDHRASGPKDPADDSAKAPRRSAMWMSMSRDHTRSNVPSRKGSAVMLPWASAINPATSGSFARRSSRSGNPDDRWSQTNSTPVVRHPNRRASSITCRPFPDPMSSTRLDASTPTSAATSKRNSGPRGCQALVEQLVDLQLRERAARVHLLDGDPRFLGGHGTTTIASWVKLPTARSSRPRCWEPGDHVPGRPEMTAFRQRLRLHQSHWRASTGHPIGTQPIVPRNGDKARGSSAVALPLDYATETGANFLDAGRVEAVRAGTSVVEPNQSVDHQRLWADLLSWSRRLLQPVRRPRSDHGLADRAVHGWWPDTPGTVPGSGSRTRRAGWIPRTSAASATSTRRSCSTSTMGRTGSSAST